MVAEIFIMFVLPIIIPPAVWYFYKRSHLFAKSDSILLLTLVMGALCFLTYDLIGIICVYTGGEFIGYVLTCMKTPVILVGLPLYYYAVDYQKKNPNKNTNRVSAILSAGAILGMVIGYVLIEVPVFRQIFSYPTLLWLFRAIV